MSIEIKTEKLRRTYCEYANIYNYIHNLLETLYGHAYYVPMFMTLQAHTWPGIPRAWHIQ